MPMKSEAMRGAMHAAAAGKSTIGIPQSVGKKFAAHDQGGKLPQRSRRNYAKGGAVFGVHPELQPDEIPRQDEIPSKRKMFIDEFGLGDNT